MSSSQGASKGKRKALLIAVRNVKGIDVSLSRTHYDAHDLKELLIKKYNYAEDDIVMLLDDPKLDASVWPSKKIIFNKIKWLVDDIREHDRLMFYYSGHGGQTTCHDDSEDDGLDEVIYGFTGHKIVDNDLKRRLVDPVSKIKGCQLFALFDCCHSETILDLEHYNCCSRMLSLVKSTIASGQTNGMDLSVMQQIKNALFISPWSIAGLVNRTMEPLCNQIVRMLKGLVKSTPSPINGPVQTAPVKQRLSVNTDTAPRLNWLMSPTRDVTSPTSTFPNARCNGTCVITKEEENEGRVVCLSACRDSELAHDDIDTGGTLTKFFISSLKKNSNISFQGLLDDVKSQVADLQAKRLREMRRGCLDWILGRRQSGITSECDHDAIISKCSTQEPRITSNRPFVCVLLLQLRLITQPIKGFEQESFYLGMATAGDGQVLLVIYTTCTIILNMGVSQLEACRAREQAAV